MYVVLAVRAAYGAALPISLMVFFVLVVGLLLLSNLVFDIYAISDRQSGGNRLNLGAVCTWHLSLSLTLSLSY